MSYRNQCLLCTAYTDLNEQFCQICLTENYFEPINKNIATKISTIICPKCNFENDLSNQQCVACDSYIFQDKSAKKKCPICDLNIFEHLFDEHTKDCFLSHEQIKKIQKAQKASEEAEQFNKNSKQCNYCKLQFPKELMNDHYKVCTVKPREIDYVSYPKKVIRSPVIKRQRTGKIQEIFNDQPLMPAQFREQDILDPQEIPRLSNLQINAIYYMHQTSKDKHNKALHSVQVKANKLGYKKNDLQNLAFYIENYAPIIIHIHINKHMEFFIKDTHYRNQFQTNKSSGTLSRASRTQWEDRMFNNKYSKAKDFERVKYGVINFTNDPKGVSCAKNYGGSYLLLKPHVRPRCTMTDMDSSNSSSHIGTFKYCYHVMENMKDNQIKSAFNAAKALEQSSSVTSTYKQIQIHGPIQFSKDIERIYVNKFQVQQKKFLDMVYLFSEKFNVPIQFI